MATLLLVSFTFLLCNMCICACSRGKGRAPFPALLEVVCVSECLVLHWSVPCYRTNMSTSATPLTVTWRTFQVPSLRLQNTIMLHMYHHEHEQWLWHWDTNMHMNNTHKAASLSVSNESKNRGDGRNMNPASMLLAVIKPAAGRDWWIIFS